MPIKLQIKRYTGTEGKAERVLNGKRKSMKKKKENKENKTSNIKKCVH